MIVLFCMQASRIGQLAVEDDDVEIDAEEDEFVEDRDVLDEAALLEEGHGQLIDFCCTSESVMTFKSRRSSLQLIPPPGNVPVL